MNALKSIHFKALRVIVNDYRQRMSRDVISVLTNRLPPRTWCKFACAMTLMKIWNTGAPAGIRQTAFANIYTKNRYPGMLFGYDSSASKVGRQITKNWCGSVLSEVKTPWSDRQLSKDRLRVLLKSTFYPFNFVTFNF